MACYPAALPTATGRVGLARRVTANRGLGHEILEVHGTLGQIMLYLIVLHVLGALKHHFYDRNGELYRMLPFGTPKA